MSRIIRLNMNEIPYPPPKEIIERGKAGLLNLNRYADLKDLERLRELLAEYSSVPKGRIVISSGSDIILKDIILIFSKGRKVILPYPSFFPTINIAKRFAIKFISFRLNPPDFDLNFDLISDELNESSLIILDNPNNPTGKILLERENVRSIVENKNALLVIDEAYYEFSGITFVDMIEKYPNMAIIRTMDKAFGIAGARVGYMISGDVFLNALPQLYEFLPKPSLYIAIEALRNSGYMRENVKKVIDERNRVSEELKGMGLEVYPSCTNFLLVKMPNTARELKDKGILVLDLSSLWLPGFIRVSIGTREENDFFLSSVKEILSY